MPRFFDDYSNTYLTHDSAAGRKQQRRGWKFRENFKLHYQKNLDEWRAGPMGLASAQQAYLRTRRNPATGQIDTEDGSVPPLPEGWKEELDEATKVCYYVNEESGKRSWVRPGFRPPPVPGPGGGPPMMMGGPMPMGGPNMSGPPPPPHHGMPPPLSSGQFRGPPPPFPPPGGPPGPPPPPHAFIPPPSHPPGGMPPPHHFPPPPMGVPQGFPRPPS